MGQSFAMASITTLSISTAAFVSYRLSGAAKVNPRLPVIYSLVLTTMALIQLSAKANKSKQRQFIVLSCNALTFGGVIAFDLSKNNKDLNSTILMLGIALTARQISTYLFYFLMLALPNKMSQAKKKPQAAKVVVHQPASEQPGTPVDVALSSVPSPAVVRQNSIADSMKLKQEKTKVVQPGLPIGDRASVFIDALTPSPSQPAVERQPLQLEGRNQSSFSSNKAKFESLAQSAAQPVPVPAAQPMYPAVK